MVLLFNSETDAAFFHLGYRDFFPVILTFLRQLPVFGTFLSLPYISNVCRICLVLVSSTGLILSHLFRSRIEWQEHGKVWYSHSILDLCCTICRLYILVHFTVLLVEVHGSSLQISRSRGHTLGQVGVNQALNQLLRLGK